MASSNPHELPQGTFDIPGNLGVAGDVVVGGTLTPGTYSLVPVSAGGTGITSYAIGDLLYASAETTLAKLADVATGSVLVSGGVGVAPAWSSTPSISGAGTIITATTSTASNNVILRLLQPSLSTANSLQIAFGRAESANNRGTMVFNYAGSGSTSNSIGFNFYGTADVFAIAASGVIAASGNVASTSSTTGTLVVTGGVGITGAVYASGTVTAGTFATSSFPPASWSGSTIVPSGNQYFGIGPPSSGGSSLNINHGTFSPPTNGVYGLNSAGIFSGTGAGGNVYGQISVSPTFSGFTNSGTFAGINISFSDPGGVSYGLQSNRKINVTEATEATTGGAASMTLTGGLYSAKKIITASQVVTGASTTSLSSLNLPHGSAPSSPVNGDIWTTTAGLFVRINGATVGPLS